MTVPDLWPAWSCGGGAPQLLEHGRPVCTRIPAVLETCAAEGREPDETEWAALLDADRARFGRGYRGRPFTRDAARELLEAIKVSNP